MNIDDIFIRALEIKSESARRQYLDKECEGDSALRQRVESLLAAHEDAASFLENPVKPIAAETTPPVEGFDPTSPPRSAHRPITEGPGTVIGRYKLLQQIGEGGMGIVYMAEQEKPVRRRVALKIIKPGMDSTQVIARFEAERQALAMMDHPNIARVLDAGCTDTGRPYFVMELVQGIPITKYCDDKQLNTRERLELFIPVCQAVQHAHQKGIIHRDIKPSNVLVTIYDGKPMPKIIDFGVAKALHQRLTEMTMFTQFGAVVGTLEYMSPEQAEMDALGTDTRSDIYSLGVLLYELLTGSTPLDGKRLRSLGYAEMLKTIREVDPPKPSTRLSQSAHDAASISANRQTEPRRLQKMIAGDLDWIVMKCLEKDRTRRYETANGLAQDIQRHLHDEAVTASPPGQLYKLQKLVRRNKLACAAAASVVLALVIGLAASVWQARRAEREAVRATAALDDLRAAAPSIAAEAATLASQEKFDEAIGKLEYAAHLRPDVPDYLLAEADLLESQLRLSDAVAVYRAALKLDPDDDRARANAELCERLVAAPKAADGKFSSQSLTELSAQMTKEKRPIAQIMPVARLLGDEKKYLVDYWLERLKNLPVGADRPLDQRLSMANEGLLYLNLSNTSVADLSPLYGMPLDELDLTNCPNVVDITPLHGMPLLRLFLNASGVTSLEPLRGMNSLDTLQFAHTSVSDLSPLAGLPIHHLNMIQSKVSSLAPLHGMPLEDLVIDYTGVADLSPLAGMPLKTLYAWGIPAQDFKPLHGLPLQDLVLIGTNVGDLGFLKGAPLKRLILWNCNRIRNLAVLSDIPTLEILLLPSIRSDIPVQDFAAIEHLRNHPSLKQLAISTNSMSSLNTVPSTDAFWQNWDGDYAWALRLRKAGFTLDWYRLGDGTARLSLRGRRFSDLSLLVGGRISQLDLGSTLVSDLSPLKSLPLTWLDVSDTPVADIAPLRGMKLDWISLYRTPVRDLSPLSGMPLTYIELGACDHLTDCAPLGQIPSLQTVHLPIHAIGLEPLRALSNLTSISFNNPQCTPEAFWKTWDGLPWARKLEAAGIAFDFSQQPDGYYDVTVHDHRFSDCSIFKGSNVRQLDLRESTVADISPLAELPLSALNVSATKLTDLSPLRSPVLSGSLHELRVANTKVVDFSPISGCRNLQVLDASDTVLADLSFVKGMNLDTLNVGRTSVSDISAVAGMPLKNVCLIATKVTDLSPLLKCPTLSSLVLPNIPHDVQSLHTLANLTRISYTAVADQPDMTADEFWGSFKAGQSDSWMSALIKLNVTPRTRRLRDGTWELILDDEPIADLSVIKGAPITRLSIARTQVTDLSPLRGMKLTNLRIMGTNISDLSPIQGMPISNLTLTGSEVRDLTPLVGMPLRTLQMQDCLQITDLTPLSHMTTLETLILPPDAKNFEFLRTFDRLRRLGYKYDSAMKGPNQTAEEFWSDYDAKQKASATQPAAADDL